jgi:hypothetical protein
MFHAFIILVHHMVVHSSSANNMLSYKSCLKYHFSFICACILRKVAYIIVCHSYVLVFLEKLLTLFFVIRLCLPSYITITPT